MSASPRRVALVSLFASLLIAGAAPAPAPSAPDAKSPDTKSGDTKSLDAQLQTLRAAKPADRPALAQDLIKQHVAVSEMLLADHKYPAATDTLRKARGLITAYVPGPAGQQLAGELDVRITLAGWREKNDGRGLRAEFFDGRDLADKVAERIDAKIDFPWHRALPTPELKRDRFSARWSGVIVAPKPGYYKLIALRDDGCRVWIDDQPLIDAWEDGHTTSEAAVELTGKPQTIRVEMFNTALGARLALHWVLPGQEAASPVPPEVFFTDKESAARLAGKPITPAKGFGLAGEYFDGEFGRRVFAHVDSDINFLWAQTRPHPAIGDRFTVRWTGFLRAPAAGKYRIIANVDDGCRVYVDQKLVLSHWLEDGIWDATADLTGKPQPVVIEYNNRTSWAHFGLAWQIVGKDTVATPIPPTAFFTDKTTAQYAPQP